MAGKIGYFGGIVQSGLVLHLDAAKKDSYPRNGGTWYDLSGNNRNVTLYNQGGSTYSSNPSGPPSYLDDNSGTFKFITPNFGKFPVYIAGSDITFSVWVKTTSGGGLLSHCNGGPVGLVYSVVSNKMEYMYYSGGWNYLYSTSNVNDGGWKNLVWAKSSTNMKQYVNGTLDSDSTLVANVGGQLVSVGSKWGPCMSDSYGAGSDSYGTCFDGNIAYFMIYNRQLSATEVTQNYNALKNRFGL